MPPLRLSVLRARQRTSSSHRKRPYLLFKGYS
jgi:hypothetical protein